MNVKLNGSLDDYTCPIAKVWENYQEKVSTNITKLNQIDLTMASLLAHTRNLERFGELLESSKKQEGLLREMKDNLLSPAIGKDHIPTKVTEAILERQEKTFRIVYRVLGSVIGALTAIIAFILTGQKFGWFGAIP